MWAFGTDQYAQSTDMIVSLTKEWSTDTLFSLYTHNYYQSVFPIFLMKLNFGADRAVGPTSHQVVGWNQP